MFNINEIKPIKNIINFKQEINDFKIFRKDLNRRTNGFIDRQNIKRAYYLFLMKKITNKPINNGVLLKTYNQEFRIDRLYLEEFERLFDKYQNLKWISQKDYNKLYKKIKCTSLLLSLSLFSSFINNASPNIGQDIKIAKEEFEYEEPLTNHLIAIANSYEEKRLEILKQKEIEQIEREEYLLYLEKAELLTHKEEKINESQYDFLLYKYASYFHLDGNKVITIAKRITNNYQNNFKEIINNDLYSIDNTESFCLTFVYLLSRNELAIDLNSLDYSFLDLKSDINPTFLESEELILSNGKKTSEFIGNISDLIHLDKNAALAISYTENGEKGSKILRENNNYGGMRINGEYLSFPTPEAGIICFCFNLKKYENYNIADINELSGIYVNGNRKLPAEIWMKNFKFFYAKIQENPEKYFNTTKDNQKKLVLILEKK